MSAGTTPSLRKPEAMSSPPPERHRVIAAGCEAPHGHNWKRETCARMVACTFDYSNVFAMSNNRLLIFDFVAGPGAWHLETKYSSVIVQ